MHVRAAVLFLAVASLVGCGDDDADNYNETVSFPVKTDTWSGGFPGVLEVSGTIDGTRKSSGNTRTVNYHLRFGGTGLNCVPKITLSADIDGTSGSIDINPPQGALDHNATITLAKSASGTAKLRIQLVESDCGPIGISLDQSTVTFKS
jgi:hypothetical protein